MKQENFILIISSPSGAGKTSIAHKILEKDKSFVPSISATTREKRHNEIEGKDYHFISKKQFQEMCAQDQFLEYAEIYNNYYGSPREYINNNLQEGFNVLFDIDWQGAKAIISKMAPVVVSIFILPPSMQELKNRLTLRKSNNSNDLENRMNSAPLEINKYQLYDYVLINDDFDKTIQKVQTIISAEKLKRKNHDDFIKNLLDPVKFSNNPI